MNCKKCNAFVPDDSAFCPECGEKVEVVWTAPTAPEAQVFCPNCGASMAAGDGFCENCGTKVEAAAPQKPASDVVGKVKEAIAKVPKNILKLGLAAVAVVLVVVILVSIFAGMGGKNNYALYYKDGELLYAEMPKGKPMAITSELEGHSTTARLSKDGKKLFFLDDYDSDDDTYTLYYKDVTSAKKEPVKLDTGVQGYVVNEKANLVTYLKDGTLYQHNLKDKTKIESDVEDFVVSADGKTIVYLADRDEEEYTCDMYRKAGNKDPEKVTGGVSGLYFLTEDGKTVYFDKEGDLYRQDKGKDPEKIESEAYMYTYYEDGSFYFAKQEDEEVKLSDLIEDDKKDDDTYDYLREYLESEDATTSLYLATLCYYDGKKSVSVAEGVADVAGAAADTAALVYVALEDGKLPTVSIADYYENGYEAIDEAMSDAGKYYVAVENNASLLELEDIAEVHITNDGKTIYVLADVDEDDDVGTLYKAKISGKKVKKAEKIDEEVSTTGNSVVGNTHYIYFKDVDDGEGELYLDGKKVDDDVRTTGIRYHEDAKKMLYVVDWNSDKAQGTLKMYKGKKATVLKDDVHAYNFTPEGEVLYLYDYDSGKAEGELWVVNGSKHIMVDEEVSSFITVAYND